ncbi:MAG: MFS transporter [Corynebacterium sp.]|nr:MFS transporter [Corynebacterium sp.]
MTSTVDNAKAIRALLMLLVIFILGTLCLQGFNLVFEQVGEDVGAPTQASLITAFPSIVLGIVCFIYGSLGDFVSLKRLVVVGLITLFVGSIVGFAATFFMEPNLWVVIVTRILQTAGEQVAGSVYLVIATKYLKPELKVIFFGLFTAGYQLSASIGVFAAGMLSSIHWQYLFLIPAVTIIFLPFLVSALPDREVKSQKVDWLGISLFGIAIAFLTLFFTYMHWWLLGVSILLFIVFALFISNAKDPFITPAFFKNSRWIMGISLIIIFYFTNYCMSPIFNAVGGSVYGLSTSEVSTHIVWAFVVAAVFGTSSGAIVDKIGRKAAIITASCLMIIGFLGAAFTINSGFGIMTVFGCVFYAGCGTMYSPVVSTVLDTLTQEESGRGVGMNDLFMNVTASIGIALFGTWMAKGTFAGSSLVGVSGAAANYANLLTIGAAVVLVGLIVFLVCNRKIYSQGPAQTAEVQA